MRVRIERDRNVIVSISVSFDDRERLETRVTVTPRNK